MRVSHCKDNAIVSIVNTWPANSFLSSSEVKLPPRRAIQRKDKIKILSDSRVEMGAFT